MPGGELALEPPPEPVRVVPAGVLVRLLPVVMIAAAIGFVLVLGVRDPTGYLFAGMIVLSTLGLLASGGGRGGASRKAEADEGRRDYLRYLQQIRRRVRSVAAEQRAAVEWAHPDPAAWPDVLAAGRMWERRPDDPDFGQLRLGRAAQRLATRLIAPQTGPVDGLEPVTALALRRLLRAHTVVGDLPVAMALGGTRRAVLRPATGNPADLAATRSLVRALLVQYVLLHSPRDAVLVVVARRCTWPVWDWVKWLPHAQHPRKDDAAGPLRMITDTVDDVRDWLESDLTGRTSGAGGASLPHVLVVLDAVPEEPGEWAHLPGVTVLRVGPGPSPVPAVRFVVRPGALGAGGEAPEPVRWIGRPDGVTVVEADALARRLARYRPARVPEPDAASPLRADVGLPDLLGIEHPAAIETARLRWSGSPGAALRVPLGVGEAGEPVLLDLKEAAQGGHGPHGLCIGATGSGKSELLRTLVLGLAATHSSAELNLVLIDFKGGASFLGLAELPHVSATITNLAEELTLVDRMADALAGEITRRQELLRAAGNFASVAEYERARRRGGSLAPLPALVIVVDEFSELLAQRPELVDEFVTIGRLGRSLGMHLLLASQRLDEGRLRGLESHLSYRIALRTFSAAESRAVIGVPDAHQLPRTPGSAYLAVGTDELVRFRAAYVSGPVVGGASGPASGQAEPAVAGLVLGPSSAPVPFTAAPVSTGRWPTAARRPDPGPAASEPEPRSATVLDAMVAAMLGPTVKGPAAHRVWLPPLVEPPALDELLGRLRTGERGLGPTDLGPPLRVPVGLIDRPYQQRRDTLFADLSGAAGHAAVVGAPQSGKSSLLATLVLALSLRHTPAELAVFVLDFGGGALTALAGLPHVAAVADRQQPDLVRRMVAEVSALLDDRERMFRAAGIESMSDYRRRRAEGRPDDGTCDEHYGDVLLVIDGLLTLRTEFEEVEAALTSLATRGLSYGVHLAVSATRWSELRPAVKVLLGTRFELRLGDPGDSEIDRVRAAAVPVRPGRGLAVDGAHMIAAAPRLESVSGPAVKAVAHAWTGSPVPAVRLLPELLPADKLPDQAGGSHRVPIGVDEQRLDAVWLDFAADPHLLVFADAECGKTNLLRLVAQGVAERLPPERAVFVVIDYRRTLLDALPAAHQIGYASSAPAAAQAAADVAASLRRRLPGPEVTPRQLRDRTWWTGPEVYVLVDDYDLIATPTGTPLQPLLEFLPQAKDVGLHVVLARRSGGAGRALYESMISRLRELAAPTLVGSGSPDEGALAEGVKPTQLPPGRGTLVGRRGDRRRIQVAWLEPPE